MPAPLHSVNMRAARSDHDMPPATDEDCGFTLTKNSRQSSSVQCERSRHDDLARTTQFLEDFHTLDKTILNDASEIFHELDKFYDRDDSIATQNVEAQRPTLGWRCPDFSKNQPRPIPRNLRPSLSPRFCQDSKDTCILTALTIPEALLQNKSSVENAPSGYNEPSPTVEPAFDVNMVPAWVYFSPKLNLFWDDRDFQKQWSRRWIDNSTNRLLSKPATPFASSLQSVTGPIGKEVIPSREHLPSAIGIALPHRNLWDTSSCGSSNMDENHHSDPMKEARENELPLVLPPQPNVVPLAVNAIAEPACLLERSRYSTFSPRIQNGDTGILEGNGINLQATASNQEYYKEVSSSAELTSMSKEVDDRPGSNLAHSETHTSSEDGGYVNVQPVQVQNKAKFTGHHKYQATVISPQDSLRQATAVVDTSEASQYRMFPTDNVQMIDSNERRRVYDTNQQGLNDTDRDDEVNLVTLSPFQSFESQAFRAESYPPCHTLPCDVPQTPLQAESSASKDTEADPTVSCSTPRLETSDKFGLSEAPRDLSKQLLPESLRKKGTDDAFSSPVFMPPPTASTRIGCLNGNTENSKQILSQMVASATATDFHGSESLGHKEGDFSANDISQDVATAVIINFREQETLSTPAKPPKPNQAPHRKSKARKSEVEKLLSATLSTHPMVSKATASTAVADGKLPSSNVQTRGRVAQHEEKAVFEAARGKTKSAAVTKRMRKASLDATALKTPGNKKARRSKRVSG